jgi:hypothetical protein
MDFMQLPPKKWDKVITHQYVHIYTKHLHKTFAQTFCTQSLHTVSVPSLCAQSLCPVSVPSLCKKLTLTSHLREPQLIATGGYIVRQNRDDYVGVMGKVEFFEISLRKRNLL